MKIALVTDAWIPQANGVVSTLQALVRALAAQGHEVDVVHPGRFSTQVSVPGSPGVGMAFWPHRALGALLAVSRPDAIHLATEGPLGWAARRHCLKRKWPFTTAFHTKFPDILHARHRLPQRLGYAVLRWFHAPSSGVLVASQSVRHMLEAKGFRRTRAWTPGVDARLFGFESHPMPSPALGPLPRPLLLYVGRVAAEKNLPDFLDLDVPGSKVVCGVGPERARLQANHPDVHWLGLLPPAELAALYACADVLVFPSRSETFGGVLLEAMACGTPVAAYPVDGPLEILAKGQGGAMDHDLREAVLRALTLSRHHARLRALDFNWAQSALQFVHHIVPIKKQKNQYRKAVDVNFMYKLSSTPRGEGAVRHTDGE